MPRDEEGVLFVRAEKGQLMEAISDWSGPPVTADVLSMVEQDLAALDSEGLFAINLEIEWVVRGVFAAIPSVKGVRAEITRCLPAFDWSRFEKLEAYLWVLRTAQASMRLPPLPDDLHAFNHAARRLRERLLAQASALVSLGLLDPRRLLALKGRSGHEQVLEDLQLLLGELSECWRRLALVPEPPLRDLADAAQLEARLREALAARARREALVRAASVRRRRAFTLVMTSYEEVRLAVAHVRREAGDADSITPSLYPPGTRARRGPEVTVVPASDTGHAPSGEGER